MAVYGLGVSGLAAIRFLQNKPLKKLVVVNRGAPESWGDEVNQLGKALPYSSDFIGEDEERCQSELATCDFILLSPGIPREHKNLKSSHQAGVPVWNEIELGYKILKTAGEPAVLALTGTNGKTTCVTFLGQVLEAAGMSPFIGGNIGRPLLDGLLAQEQGKEIFDCYLFEVSSFQCESLEEFRPQVAGILNLFANHGERYVDVESYRQAKWLLGKNQKEQDVMLTGPGTELPNYQYQGNHLVISETASEALEKEFSLKELKLIGIHNRWNLAFCWNLLMASAPFLKKDIGHLKEAFQKVLNIFPGVEHRLEYVGQWSDMAIYNDAKSTNWQATITALKAVKERGLKSLVVIGGQLRGHGDEAPLEFLNELTDKTHVVMMGESGEFLKEKGISFPYYKNLEAVKDYAKTLDGFELMLFSPAFPSFDQFSNYKERGKVFKNLFRD